MQLKINFNLKTVIIVFVSMATCLILYYFAAFLPMRQKSSYIKNLQTELISKDKELDTIRSQATKSATQVVPNQSKQNSDMILINYKLDVRDTEKVLDLLSNLAYEDEPLKMAQVCFTVIANRTSRNHTYYMAVDSVNALESRYGKYRNSISYIDNNLYGLKAAIQIFVDHCNSLGYYF